MAHPHRVLRSVNFEGESVCVDIFQRADGTFGFDTFRRDPEDQRGWYSVGHFGHAIFETETAVTAAAICAVDWFQG